ncbi:RNA polymerase sigma factor RpoE [Thorsellia anophelis]|uniref:RNA polymerase sigma-70 factor, ECF subfamily n=1 Tax=Thorsellia anophelis DSM 18579 TaxID=1123402 RepID=A0A1I0C301_9GAMM|nr:RNA polymerase sigma factor RpoE [Thorsellia anophelis]SET13145.1 RNA polymerase sigma-70 factor, ECF subfamily [Thorsellia anophelis DSM 18579]
MKREELTDQILVEKVQAGDQQAFNLLVIRYQNKVASVVSKYVPYSDIADVTQEVFIKAYRSLHSFRGDSSFYTWLYRVASNIAKNHLTAEKRTIDAIDMGEQDISFFESNSSMQEIDNPESIMISEELNDVVFSIIQSLPDDLRVAIVLRELEGMSYDEIAVKMNCPVGTVRSRIFRARDIIDTQILPHLKNR